MSVGRANFIEFKRITVLNESTGNNAFSFLIFIFLICILNFLF